MCSLELFGKDSSKKVICGGAGEVERPNLRGEPITTILNWFYYRRLFRRRELVEGPVLK